jgi:hypothetical protein
MKQLRPDTRCLQEELQDGCQIGYASGCDPITGSFFKDFAVFQRNQAGLAQLVEHLICNQGVVGSSPIAGTIVSSRNTQKWQ